MSGRSTLDDLEPIQRELLRGLAAGASARELSDSADRPMAEVVELTLAALTELAGDPANLEDVDQLAIVGYLLGRQPAGEAAGTWTLLESSSDATRWARELRDAIGDLAHQDAAPLPSDDDAVSPTAASRLDGGAATAGQGLARRRAARETRRSQEAVEAAQAELESPYRPEAVEAHAEAEDRIDLPDFAPRPVRMVAYVLLAVLIGALAFAIFFRIPVNTTATVLVVDVPADAPGGDRRDGLSLLALYPLESSEGGAQALPGGADVREGDELRVALPGEQQREGVDISWVSPQRLSPREIVDRYGLQQGQANIVRAPSVVSLSPIDPPGDRSPESFEGTTTTEASVQTGTQRIISLLF